MSGVSSLPVFKKKMNPEKEQDRAFDFYDHYKRFGFILFPQSKKIYENLRFEAEGRILEAGCGNGVGSYILEPRLATDILESNIKFAKEIYPRIEFDVWDITKDPWKEKYDTVICVETIEHVTDIKEAIKNLVASAKKDVWISTPNNQEETPSNPFHTREYSAKEFVEFLKPHKYEILHWDTFKKLDENTKVSPLVYHIIL